MKISQMNKIINLSILFKNFNSNKLLSWGPPHIIAVLMLLALIFVGSKAWIKQILFYSGYLSTVFLLSALLLNPLKLIFPQSRIIKKLNNYRREIGVSSFSYAFIHVICFVMKKASIAKILPYLIKPAIIPTLFLAFPILAILTLTSNNFSIKKLGFQKWKNLHKKVYWALPPDATFITPKLWYYTKSQSSL